MNRAKASSVQLSYLAEHMKNHAEMASGHLNNTLQERADLESKWDELANHLNSLGGPIKSVAKWKQAWRDLRNNVKKKASHIKNEYKGYDPGSTGNASSTIKELSAVEEDGSSVEVPVAIYCMEDVAPTEIFTQSASPSQILEQKSPLPGLPVDPRLRKRKRIFREHDSFESKLLNIEEENLRIKRERNEIEIQRNAILNKIADALNEISNQLN